MCRRVDSSTRTWSFVSSDPVDISSRPIHTTAQGHVDREKAWWLENRDHGEVFAEELEEALKIIVLLPSAGSIYAQSPGPDVRRVY
jgi:hypothetical protein